MSDDVRPIRPLKPFVDEDAIRHLEQALVWARSGELVGVLIAAELTDGRCARLISANVDILRMLGYLETIKAFLVRRWE